MNDMPTLCEKIGGNLFFVARPRWDLKLWVNDGLPVFVDWTLFTSYVHRRRENTISVGDTWNVGGQSFFIIRRRQSDYLCRRVLAVPLPSPNTWMINLVLLAEVIERLFWWSIAAGRWRLPIPIKSP